MVAGGSTCDGLGGDVEIKEELIESKVLIETKCILIKKESIESGKHFPTCAVPLFGSTLFCHMCSSSFDL